jgi:hypothetical protein
VSTSTDSLWPSAHSLLSTNGDPSKTTVTLLGVPTFATSLTLRSSESTLAAVRLLSRHPQVRAMAFTDVDVARDSADQRTVRPVALLGLESLAGVIGRNS